LDITDNRFVYYNYDFANKSMKNSQPFESIERYLTTAM